MITHVAAQRRLPDAIDTSQPSAARVYDYLLGGKDNYDADRTAAQFVLDVAPEMADVARENRRWLVRVVRHLVEQGFDQFIDLGSGLPTQENVHETAQSLDPGARVVYVDHDPMVLAHARALLEAGNGTTAYVHADVRNPREVLDAPELARTIDLTRPVALLAVAVLHFVADEDGPARIVRTYADALPSGSRVAIACGSSDGLTGELAERVRTYFGPDVPSPLYLRSRQEIAALFGDMHLEEPGLVRVTDWPAPTGTAPLPMTTYGAIGRVP